METLQKPARCFHSNAEDELSGLSSDVYSLCFFARYPTAPQVAPQSSDKGPCPVGNNPPLPLPSLLFLPPTRPPHSPTTICCSKSFPPLLPSCRTCQDPCRAGPECTPRSTLTGPESIGTTSPTWSNGGKDLVDNVQIFSDKQSCFCLSPLMFGYSFFSEIRMTFSWCGSSVVANTVKSLRRST